MNDQFGASFEKRLKQELDRFKPPTPRPETARFHQPQAGYVAQVGQGRLGGLKPALAVAAALAIFTVAASAVSGSPNPGVWTERAVNSIESMTGSAPPSPSPEPREEPVGPATHAEPSEAPESDRESADHSGGADREPLVAPSPEP